MERIHSQFQASTSEVAAVPLHGLSAKTGEGAQDLLPAAMHLYDTWNKRLTTSRLNTWKEKVTSLADSFCIIMPRSRRSAQSIALLAHGMHRMACVIMWKRVHVMTGPYRCTEFA